MTWNDKTIPDESQLAAVCDEMSPMKFEQRQCDRWPADFAATAFELGGNSFGHMHQIRVVDYSDGGLGAISDTPIAPGSIISIGFASPGMSAKRGTVLRCTPCGNGYRLSIRFEERLAA
jgi:hypothetical protein